MYIIMLNYIHRERETEREGGWIVRDRGRETGRGRESGIVRVRGRETGRGREIIRREEEGEIGEERQ